MIKRDILLGFVAFFLGPGPWLYYLFLKDKINKHRSNRESAGGQLFAREDNISK